MKGEGDSRGKKELEGKWGGGLIHSDKEVVEGRGWQRGLDKKRGHGNQWRWLWREEEGKKSYLYVRS